MKYRLKKYKSDVFYFLVNCVKFNYEKFILQINTGLDNKYTGVLQVFSARNFIIISLSFYAVVWLF